MELDFEKAKKQNKLTLTSEGKVIIQLERRKDELTTDFSTYPLDESKKTDWIYVTKDDYLSLITGKKIIDVALKAVVGR